MNTFRYFLLLSLIGLSIPCSAQLLGRGGKTNAKARSGVIRMKQYNDTLGTYFWSHFDATKRSSLNFIKKGRVQVLAEVQPDAVVQKALELAAKGNTGKGVSGEASMKTAETIAVLGQRTAPVNMLRDGLYRIAELRYNDPDNYTPEVVERMMIALFNMVEKIAVHTAPQVEPPAKATEPPVAVLREEAPKQSETSDQAGPKN